MDDNSLTKKIADSYELANNVLEHIPNPLVSIRTSAYNHGPYIKQCIEGVLMQRTNFPFEYIIGEDFSNDETREIVFEYAKKYPNIIRVITADYNVGSRANGRRCIQACRGKYMAICEGDDYWIDSLKLQKQVDFMESHPEYSLCFHATNCIYGQDENPCYTICYDKSEFNMDDLILGGGGMMATNSMLYKSDFVRNVPLWVQKAPVGDLPLMLLLGAYGKVHYIDEIMSVYRLGVGVWSSGVERDKSKLKRHYEALYKMFYAFDKWSNYSHSYIVKMELNKLKQQYRKAILIYYLKKIFGEKSFYKFRKSLNKSKK